MKSSPGALPMNFIGRSASGIRRISGSSLSFLPNVTGVNAAMFLCKSAMSAHGAALPMPVIISLISATSAMPVASAGTLRSSRNCLRTRIQYVVPLRCHS
jgi:hypothetical protein